MKLIYGFLIMMLLASCSGSSSVGSQIGNTDSFTDLTAQDDVFIDALGVLPLDGSAIARYTVRVNNNSAQNYTLASVQVGAEQAEPLAVVSSRLLRVDAAACKKLPADSSCDLQLTPYASSSADVLILLNFRDKQGNQKTVKQMVRMSTELKHNNGFAVFNDLNTLITKDGSYSLALPLILERDFESIVALNGYLRCQDLGFRQGNHCSYLIKGRALADNTLLTTQLTGFVADKKIAQTQANILIKNKAEANLVLSHGVSLIADGRTTSDLSIYNNGTAPAPLKVSVDRDVEIIDWQGCLNQALAAQSECRIGLRAKENQQQRSSAFIVYYDEKSVSTTLNYTSPAQASLINISSNNSLQNTPVSTSSGQIITITNSSSNNLNGIAVAIAGAKPAGLTLGLIAQAQGGCNTPNNITLAAGASCRVALQYSPVESENSIIQLQVSVAGAEQKPAIYSYSVDYSAIKPTNYLAISQIKNVTLAATAVSHLEEESFSLTNLAPAVPLQLNQILLEDLSAQLKLNLDSCAVGTILDEQHPQCVGRINYSSVIGDSILKSANLSVHYDLSSIVNSGVYSQSNNFTFIRKSSTVIDPIKPEPIFEAGVKIIESFVVEVSGDGAIAQEHESATEPYRVFLTDKASTITLKYTFTNIGDKSATNFRVDEDNKVATALKDALNDAEVNSAITHVSVNNNCSDVLAAKGGSCTVQFMWTGTMKPLYELSDKPLTPQFSLEMELCYAKNTDGSHVCQAVLQKEKLDVIVSSKVVDINAQIFSTKAVFWKMATVHVGGGTPPPLNKKSMKTLDDLEIYFPVRLQGRITLNNLNKYSFKTKPKANTVKVEVRDSTTLQVGNPPNHVLVYADYIAGKGECKLEGNRPCSFEVEYRSFSADNHFGDGPCYGYYLDFLEGGTLAQDDGYNFNSCTFEANNIVILVFTDDDGAEIARQNTRWVDWIIND